MHWVNLLHFYQPPNQDASQLKRIASESYLYIIKTLRKNPQAKLTVNISGSLTEQLIKLKLNEVINGLKNLGKKGQIEFTSTAKYHPIFPLLPQEEIIRQIEINDKINQTYLGVTYQPKGFFLPEMAYSKKIAEIIKELGFEWIILDEISFNGQLNQVDYNKKYIIKDIDLAVVFRNRRLSKSFVPESILELVQQPKPPLFAISATDAEMYGHHHKDFANLFSKSLKREDIETITISQLLRLYQKKQEIEPVAASWESSEEELKAKQPYIVWNDPKNEIQKLLWQLANLAIKLVNEQQKDSAVEWARRHLDLGLASCSWWWSSERKPDIFTPLTWHPDFIEKGAKELILSIRSLEKLPAETKIQAEKIYLHLSKNIWKKHWGNAKGVIKEKINRNFNKIKIERRKNQIFKKYNLTPKYILSTSGHYFVTNCIDNKNKKFILKLRLKNLLSAKKTFMREIAFWQALADLKNYPLGRPQKIFADTKNKPEFLLYREIEGESIGNFYQIYHPAEILKKHKKIVQALIFLQDQTAHFKKKIPQLPKYSFKENIAFSQSFYQTAKKYLNQELLAETSVILKKHRNFINQQPLKLCHSDLNPRNVISSGKNFAIIDWSNVCLNNQLYDLAFFSLCFWQKSEADEKFLQTYFQKFKQTEKLKKLFYLNQLIIIPKFIQILNDSVKFADTRQKKLISQAFKTTEKTLKEKIAFFKKT